MSVAAEPSAASRGRALLERVDGLLTWKRARNYSVLVGLVYVAAWVYFSFAGTAPLNRLGEPLGGDYIAFHTAGRMLLRGQAGQLYDPAAVRATEAQTLNEQAPGIYDPLRNPPFFALIFVPFAGLDLVPSFAAWTLVSVAMLAIAVWLALDMVGLRGRWRAVACIVFGFAPVYLGLVGGQNSSLALLLYVLIYRALWNGDDTDAGAWAALGLFKPQLFLLFPLIFVVSRRWRALMAYAAVAGVLGAISLALVGPAGIGSWMQVLFSNNLEAGIALKQGFRMHSLKSLFDLLLTSSPGAALSLYTLLSIALVAPVLRLAALPAAWSRQRLPELFSLFCVVGVLIDPHIFDYDLIVLVLAALLVGSIAPGTRWFVVGFYALMFLREPVPLGDAYLQLSVPVLLLFAIWLYRRLAKDIAESSALSRATLEPALSVLAESA